MDLKNLKYMVTEATNCKKGCEMNYSKRCEFDAEKDCFLVKREDAQKVFQMLFDSIYNEEKSLSEDEYDYMIKSPILLRIEHRMTLEKVIDALGMTRNYVEYSTEKRKELK